MQHINNMDTDVLACAFRYALGRMTYVVSVVSEEIIKHWKELPESDKAKYYEEIEEARMNNHLGMEMDKEQWLKIRELYIQEQGKKTEKNGKNL